MDVVLSTLWSVAALHETIKENLHHFNINKTISKKQLLIRSSERAMRPSGKGGIFNNDLIELVFPSPRLVAKLDKIIQIHVKMSKVLFDEASKLALYFQG